MVALTFNWIILLLAGFVVTLLIIFIILTLMEKEILRRRAKVKPSLSNKYSKKLAEIKRKKSSPEEKAEEIEKIMREFTREAFHIPRKLEYPDVIDRLRKIGKNSEAELCESIMELRYSGRKLGNSEIDSLIGKFSSIFEKDKRTQAVKKTAHKGYREVKIKVHKALKKTHQSRKSGKRRISRVRKKIKRQKK